MQITCMPKDHCKMQHRVATTLINPHANHMHAKRTLQNAAQSCHNSNESTCKSHACQQNTAKRSTELPQLQWIHMQITCMPKEHCKTQHRVATTLINPHANHMHAKRTLQSAAQSCHNSNESTCKSHACQKNTAKRSTELPQLQWIHMQITCMLALTHKLPLLDMQCYSTQEVNH